MVGLPENSPGFFVGEIFAGQFDCDLPIPAPGIGHDSGCGIRKTQTRKLQLLERRRAKDADVILPHVESLVQGWQLLVVSARFREAALAKGLSGLNYLPISGPKACAEDRLLSSGSCASDTADYFQCAITGRSKPLPIRDFTVKRGPCGICGSVVGKDEPYRLSQPLAATLFAGDPDIQACDELALPGGRTIGCLDGHVFVSSRFLELCLREKFRGFSSWSGRAPNFTALYFGEGM